MKEKVLELAKDIGKEALNLALCLMKKVTACAAKLTAKLTAKVGKEIGQRALTAAAPVAKIVMLASCGVAVVSGLCWFFGRKK